MKLQSLHTHSLYDDGKSTLEQMVQSAIAHDLSALGFSGHSPMPSPQSWTIQQEDLPKYRAEAARLKQKYQEQIHVYCGLELDLCSPLPTDSYDYIIGSVHHVPVNGTWVSVDDSLAVTRNNVLNLFHADSDAYAKAYYDQVERVAQYDCVQIAGHLDLLTKYNEQEPLVNTDTLAYYHAVTRAMEALIAADKIIEINSGAISRGYRSTPYPAFWLLQQLQRMGARITITADAHHADAVACAYDDALARAKAAGFTELWLFDGQTFGPCAIE